MEYRLGGSCYLEKEIIEFFIERMKENPYIYKEGCYRNGLMIPWYRREWRTIPSFEPLIETYDITSRKSHDEWGKFIDELLTWIGEQDWFEKLEAAYPAELRLSEEKISKSGCIYYIPTMKSLSSEDRIKFVYEYLKV